MVGMRYCKMSERANERTSVVMMVVIIVVVTGPGESSTLYDFFGADCMQFRLILSRRRRRPETETREWNDKLVARRMKTNKH